MPNLRTPSARPLRPLRGRSRGGRAARPDLLRTALCVALGAAFGALRDPGPRPPVQAQDPASIGEHLERGLPTFIVGSVGGERSLRATRAQARLVRDLLFPEARILLDVEIDVAAGPTAWPAVPVLYGGSHVNTLLARLGPALPLRVSAGVIEIGGQRFEGSEYRLLALVPSGSAGPEGPAWPAFALYAGAGSPGIEEINAIPDRGAGFLVADRFGMLVLGHFQRGEDGALAALVTGSARRLPWRGTEVALEGLAARVGVRRLELDTLTALHGPEDSAIARGILRALTVLGIGDGELELGAVHLPTVHVYPDAGSKRALSRDGGDGHADLPSRSLHVARFDPAPGGPMEGLIAHEAVHVLATQLVGPPGSPLFGEGLAVWVAGGYGGRSLAGWRADPPAGMRGLDLQSLLGRAWTQLPEGVAYPAAGLVVAMLVDEVGLDPFLEHLYPASFAELEAAARAAGLEPDGLAGKVRALLAEQDR
jgi:hypothetical protein